ncbi:hypothetical protein [Pedobacter sp. N23S346]|uniref:hypothetical protein n=1 Tax=Pedobacter sp. N23S346 TaxID=3402750 RepID=UPI003AC76E3A
MTRQKINRFNEKLDEVHRMMTSKGYDNDKLNKAFLVFNLSSLSEEKDAFQFIIKSLIRMNENAENYEICQYLQVMQKDLNRTRTTWKQAR